MRSYLHDAIAIVVLQALRCNATMLPIKYLASCQALRLFVLQMVYGRCKKFRESGSRWQMADGRWQMADGRFYVTQNVDLVLMLKTLRLFYTLVSCPIFWVDCSNLSVILPYAMLWDILSKHARLSCSYRLHLLS